MALIGKAHTHTTLYRTCYEWNAALGWSLAAFVIVGMVADALIYGPPESGKRPPLSFMLRKKGGYIYVNLKDLRLKNPDIATLFRFCNSKIYRR